MLSGVTVNKIFTFSVSRMTSDLVFLKLMLVLSDKPEAWSQYLQPSKNSTSTGVVDLFMILSSLCR